jgi:hypothetical protein
MISERKLSDCATVEHLDPLEHHRAVLTVHAVERHVRQHRQQPITADLIEPAGIRRPGFPFARQPRRPRLTERLAAVQIMSEAESTSHVLNVRQLTVTLVALIRSPMRCRTRLSALASFTRLSVTAAWPPAGSPAGRARPGFSMAVEPDDLGG